MAFHDGLCLERSSTAEATVRSEPVAEALLLVKEADGALVCRGNPGSSKNTLGVALAEFASRRLTPSLTSLRLIGIQCIPQAFLQQLVDQCPRLETLELPASELPSREPLSLAERRRPALVDLRLSRPPGAWALQQLPASLTELSLTECGSLHPSSLVHLRGLTGLLRLSLRGFRVPLPAPASTQQPGATTQGPAGLRRRVSVAAATAAATASGVAAGVAGVGSGSTDPCRSTGDGGCGAGGSWPQAEPRSGATGAASVCPVASSLEHWSRLVRLQELELLGQPGADPGDAWDALLPAFLPALTGLSRLAFHPPSLRDPPAALAPLARCAALRRLELGACCETPLPLHHEAWRALAAAPALDQLLLGHCDPRVSSGALGPAGGGGAAVSLAAVAAAATLTSWGKWGSGGGGGGGELGGTWRSASDGGWGSGGGDGGKAWGDDTQGVDGSGAGSGAVSPVKVWGDDLYGGSGGGGGGSGGGAVMTTPAGSPMRLRAWSNSPLTTNSNHATVGLDLYGADPLYGDADPNLLGTGLSDMTPIHHWGSPWTAAPAGGEPTPGVSTTSGGAASGGAASVPPPFPSPQHGCHEEAATAAEPADPLGTTRGANAGPGAEAGGGSEEEVLGLEAAGAEHLAADSWGSSNVTAEISTMDVAVPPPVSPLAAEELAAQLAAVAVAAGATAEPQAHPEAAAAEAAQSGGTCAKACGSSGLATGAAGASDVAGMDDRCGNRGVRDWTGSAGPPGPTEGERLLAPLGFADGAGGAGTASSVAAPAAASGAGVFAVTDGAEAGRPEDLGEEAGAPSAYAAGRGLAAVGRFIDGGQAGERSEQGRDEPEPPVLRSHTPPHGSSSPAAAPAVASPLRNAAATASSVSGALSTGSCTAASSSVPSSSNSSCCYTAPSSVRGAAVYGGGSGGTMGGGTGVIGIRLRPAGSDDGGCSWCSSCATADEVPGALPFLSQAPPPPTQAGQTAASHVYGTTAAAAARERVPSVDAAAASPSLQSSSPPPVPQQGSSQPEPPAFQQPAGGLESRGSGPASGGGPESVDGNTGVRLGGPSSCGTTVGAAASGCGSGSGTTSATGEAGGRVVGPCSAAGEAAIVAAALHAAAAYRAQAEAGCAAAAGSALTGCGGGGSGETWEGAGAAGHAATAAAVAAAWVTAAAAAAASSSASSPAAGTACATGGPVTDRDNPGPATPKGDLFGLGLGTAAAVALSPVHRGHSSAPVAGSTARSPAGLDASLAPSDPAAAAETRASPAAAAAAAIAAVNDLTAAASSPATMLSLAVRKARMAKAMEASGKPDDVTPSSAAAAAGQLAAPAASRAAPSGIRPSAPFSALRRLSLFQLDDASLVAMAGCWQLQRQLRCLSVGNAAGMGAAGMRALPRLNRLERLSLLGLRETFDSLLGDWASLDQLHALELGMSRAAAAALVDAEAAAPPLVMPPPVMPPTASRAAGAARAPSPVSLTAALAASLAAAMTGGPAVQSSGLGTTGWNLSAFGGGLGAWGEEAADEWAEGPAASPPLSASAAIDDPVADAAAAQASTERLQEGDINEGGGDAVGRDGGGGVPASEGGRGTAWGDHGGDPATPTTPAAAAAAAAADQEGFRGRAAALFDEDDVDAAVAMVAAAGGFNTEDDEAADRWGGGGGGGGRRAGSGGSSDGAMYGSDSSRRSSLRSGCGASLGSGLEPDFDPEDGDAVGNLEDWLRGGGRTGATADAGPGLPLKGHPRDIAVAASNPFLPQQERQEQQQQQLTPKLWTPSAEPQNLEDPGPQRPSPPPASAGPGGASSSGQAGSAPHDIADHGTARPVAVGAAGHASADPVFWDWPSGSREGGQGCAAVGYIWGVSGAAGGIEGADSCGVAASSSGVASQPPQEQQRKDRWQQADDPAAQVPPGWGIVSDDARDGGGGGDPAGVADPWDVDSEADAAVRWAPPIPVQSAVRRRFSAEGAAGGGGGGDGGDEDERVHGGRRGVSAMAAAAAAATGSTSESKGGAAAVPAAAAAAAPCLTDNGLQVLLQLLPRLKEVHLHNLPHLTPATLEQVLSRPGLRSLQVDGCRHLTRDYCELLAISAMDLTSAAGPEPEGGDDVAGSEPRLQLRLLPA